ncbi:IS5 family transposase [Diaphorobacter aerolatus]|uniref:IS5 family transposase n=1 Tax=Diaphorobacter aerolatus TaxID=1288495 RepID=A0A7H0GQ34_9BURK|nr:IS5 family transposase [Diaphorobacter aerolatus]QNP50400.1 IS5 family transposase [Diaphorobacter aerolatus]
MTPRSALKFDLFAETSRKRKIDEMGDPLQVIAQHIDFTALARLVDGIIERSNARKGGRPAYPAEVMVRVMVLKRLYNLSDEQMEYQLLDRMSYQRFCLLQQSMNVPDRNTIWRFGERLGVDGATALLQGVDEQLHRHGYIARGGQSIDATLVPAPRQRMSNKERDQLGNGQKPDWSEAKARQKDTDATHTRKHDKSYFGYKLSVSVDHKHGFIRGVATGTASEHDGHHFDEVLDLRNTGKDVNADKAYTSAQRREMLAALGFNDGMQRKAGAGKPLSDCQKRRNHRIAKTRAKVEHVFAGIRHMGGKFVRTIGQVGASTVMTLMAACYNLKRLASFLENGIDPFFKSKPSKIQARLQAA